MIMNKIKLLLLWLITPLLFGVSFAINLSSNDIDYLDTVSFASGSFSNIHTKQLYVFTDNVSSDNIRNVCVVFSWLTASDNFSSTFGVVMVNTAPWNRLSTPLWLTYKPATPYTLMCINWRRQSFNVGSLASDTSLTYSTDNWRLFYADDLLNIRNNWGWSSSCDYSSYESTINTLSWNLATCNTNLNNCLNSNCDTQLSQCIIDRDNALSSITTLSWSLLSCNEDKASLQNYNNSLTDQLNQCLLWSWDNLSWSACFDYSMFWQDGNDNYSLPITNNLFLPSWYKWKYNEDKIVSIAPINSIENALLFDDTAKETTVNSLAYIMLFLLATWLIMVLLRFLKKLFKL